MSCSRFSVNTCLVGAVMLIGNTWTLNIPCPSGSGMENVKTNSFLIYCYGVIDPTKGPMTYTQAVQECDKLSIYAHVVTTESKEYLRIIYEWAVSKGVPNNTKAGLWTGYTRKIAAPLEDDGTLSVENAEIRKDRTLFKYWTGHPASVHIWRNDTQPGNTVDERDEMCTAQRSPYQLADNWGIDDYPCEGYQLHYAVCKFP